MSFSKAVQVTNTPEYRAYLIATLMYKRHCSEYTKIRRRYSTATEPLERLVFLEAEKTFSKQCKEYHAARKTYTDFIIGTQMKAKGISLTDLQRTLGITVATSMEDMLAEIRREALAKSVSDEEYEKIKTTALANMSKNSNGDEVARHTLAERGSVKDQIIASKAIDDPTLDMSDTF